MPAVTHPGSFGNPLPRMILRWRGKRRKVRLLLLTRATPRAVIMVEFCLGSAKCPIRRILCLGAHCDDIEIGCGGTILRWLREDPEREIYWVAFSSNPVRKREGTQ